MEKFNYFFKRLLTALCFSGGFLMMLLIFDELGDPNGMRVGPFVLLMSLGLWAFYHAIDTFIEAVADEFDEPYVTPQTARDLKTNLRILIEHIKDLELSEKVPININGSSMKLCKAEELLDRYDEEVGE